MNGVWKELPAHNLLPQIFKLGLGEAFGEDVPKLLGCVNFIEFDAARTDLRTEPVILHGVMLLAGCHSTGLHLAKNETTGVVLMNSNVKMGRRADGKSETSTQFLEQVSHRKKTATRSAERDVFSLHR